MKSKLKKGMYITFEGCTYTIYKIIDINKNYVLVKGDCLEDYWERTEYIENIITFENMKVEKYVDC